MFLQNSLMCYDMAVSSDVNKFWDCSIFILCYCVSCLTPHNISDPTPQVCTTALPTVVLNKLAVRNYAQFHFLITSVALKTTLRARNS
jgi:hypothetical protein